MGVINITPNSFSDQHFNFENLQNQLKTFLQEGVDIWDIGAESTAPFNSAISAYDEWYRLEQNFFKNIALTQGPPKALSFDTYKCDVIEKILLSNYLKSFAGEVIWNDISGCLDDRLFSILNKHPQLHYVFSHNLASKRELSSSHMDFVYSGDNLLLHLKHYFQNAYDQFFKEGLGDRIIFDPCFGFSKTREQNLWLLENLSELINEFPQQKWLIGISKKSFLRSESDNLLTGEAKFKNSETLHEKYLSRWSKEFADQEMIFRVHNPSIIKNI